MTKLQELKDQRIWLLWKFVNKNGKKTKLPISATGSRTGTSSNYSVTWVTYEEAIAATSRQEANGVGLVLPKGYFLLDLDERELNDPLVQELRARFKTYCEFSPSGKGLHMLGYCDLEKLPLVYDDNGEKPALDKAYYQKNSKLGMELYIGGLTNRYATFTGQAIDETDLQDCSGAVRVTLNHEMRKQDSANSRTAKRKKRRKKSRFEKKAQAVEIIENLNLTPEELNTAADNIISELYSQKNDLKFHTLFSDGNFENLYGSQSEADCGLCAIIAFRTGPYPELIDAVFRKSALYREKWEREDYRTATIKKGIEACQGTFYGKDKDPLPFIEFDGNGKAKINPSILAEYAREHINYILVRDSGRQCTMKYVYENGYYRFYDDSMMMGLIKQFVVDYDIGLLKMSDISNAVQDINTDLNYISRTELNTDENIINFQNGLLHVSANGISLQPHSPEIYSTVQLPCAWKNEAIPTPVFDKYLEKLTNGDEEIKQLLLEWIGVCLSNVKGWRMKKSLFLVGAGDTGKSQLKSLVERILGSENFIGIDLKEIEARFGTSTLYEKRLAGSSDMSYLSIEELKTFKKLTGGDSVFAEFKGQQGFEFTYSGLLWFCMNKLPKFGGDNGKWVFERIMVVDCPNVIPKAEQDKQLLDKMYAERQGIIYKAIQALQRVFTNEFRFTETESMLKRREAYHDEVNTVVSFFDECMCEVKNGTVDKECKLSVLYEAYEIWCKQNNNGCANAKRDFKKELAEHLEVKANELTTKRNGCYYLKGYTINTDTKDLYNTKTKTEYFKIVEEFEDEVG